MENEGDRPARGKSRKSKERAGNSSSAKRPPPILLSEEGDSAAAAGGGAKGPVSGAAEKPPARGSRAKATRRAEREPTSPEQEEDIIDGFAIVSFRAEESLKNALKKHCNVYENRIMQLPYTRGQSSSSCRGGGAADATASSSRSCTSGVTTSAAAAAEIEGNVDGTVEESPKRAAVSKGSLGHSGKGKENKGGTTPAGSIATLGGDTSSSPASTTKNSSVQPTSTRSPSSDAERRTEATLTAGKPSDFSSKRANSAVNKSLEAELSLLASVPPKGTTAPTVVSEQAPLSSSSSAGPPELFAAVNLSSSTGDLPPASPVASEGVCSVSLCASAPSPLHPQVTVGNESAVPQPPPSPAVAIGTAAAAAVGGSSSNNRESLSSSSSKRSKSSEPPSGSSASLASQPAAASAATAGHGGSGRSSAGVRGSSSLWPRGGEGKTHATSSTQLAGNSTGRSSSAGSSGGGGSAAAPSMAAWHAAVDGTGASASSSMASSAQPFISAYGNHVATMLGMASQPMPGAGQPFFSTPNIMAFAAAAAAAGLPMLPPAAAFSPEFAAQELQRELSCRLLGSPMDRASLLSLPSAYLPGGGGATTANGIPHAQLYEQMLHSAAAAGLPQHQAATAQHQHAVAAAAAAAAAAAGVPLSSLAGTPYGVSLVSAPSSHVFSGKAPKLDSATLALWGQPVSGAFPLSAAAAAQLHASASGTGPSPFQSIPSTAGPVFGDTSANFATKKSGKWCSAHVRIAWQIYQSQRKTKLEQSGSAGTSMTGFPGLRSDGAMGSHLSMLTAPPTSAAAGGGGSGSSSRSSVLSAAAHESLHRAASGNGVPPPLLSSASGTPPSNAARSPHNANLSYSPAAAAAAMGSGFPTLPSSRDLAEWTARLGGAAALLSLAPAVMGWQHHLRPAEPGHKDGAVAATVVDRSGQFAVLKWHAQYHNRPSLPFGFGRELGGGGADGFTDSRAAPESHSRRSGSKERGRGAASGGGVSSHRPRSRSPLRARSRESSTAAERVRVKAERRDLDETVRPSSDRQAVACGGGNTAAAAMDLLLQQQQQQLLSAQPPPAGFGLPVDALNGSRWASALSIPSGHAAATSASAAATNALTVPASSASALSVGDRRLWSPFERHSSAEAMPGTDVDQRDSRPHLNYRLAAIAAAAERVMPPSAASRGSGRGSSGSSRVKASSSSTPHPSGVSSPSGSTAAAAAAAAGSAVSSSPITLNGHRSAAAAMPAQSAGSGGCINSSGRDRPLSPPATVGLASGSIPELPAPPCILLPVRKTSSPGHPCATAATAAAVAAQVNGGASSDGSVPGSESETHSR